MSNQHVKKSYNYSYVIKYETCTLTCFKDVLLFKKINMLNVDEKDIQLYLLILYFDYKTTSKYSVVTSGLTCTCTSTLNAIDKEHDEKNNNNMILMLSPFHVEIMFLFVSFSCEKFALNSRESACVSQS